MATPTRTLLILIGPPGAGKTAAAKTIMASRENELRQPLHGTVLSVNHPDGERNKKGNGIKQVSAGVVVDGHGGLALLGRYATTHSEFWKSSRNKLMEGADRLAVGKEKGTWSQLLRPGVSPLASYSLLVVDSCDEATLHASHLHQARAAGWVIRVRELAIDRDSSRKRCIERNYAGRSSSLLQPRLTPMEREWNEDFDEKVAQLRARFSAYDYAIRSQNEVVTEASALLHITETVTDQCAAAPQALVAQFPQKRSIAPLAPQKAAKKRLTSSKPQPQPQPQRLTLKIKAPAPQGDELSQNRESLVAHALREAQDHFRIEAGTSRWSLWDNVTGKRVGKIEAKARKIRISCTIRGSQWSKSATTAAQATELVNELKIN